MQKGINEILSQFKQDDYTVKLCSSLFSVVPFAPPFQFYNSLMLVQEYGVWDKLLFGTDYPFTTVNSTVDGLRKLNDMLVGTALPRLNVDAIEELIYRNSLPLLGLM